MTDNNKLQEIFELYRARCKTGSVAIAENNAIQDIEALIASAEIKARIDENRVMWDLPKDKGLVYFEEHIQKRFKKLDAQLQAREEKRG